MTVAEPTWPPIAVRLLLAACRPRAGRGGTVRYAPSAWFDERPTSVRRQRWSRWTRRLADAGLLERVTETSRDRVTAVRITAAGRSWIEQHCGPGALDEPESIAIPLPEFPAGEVSLVRPIPVSPRADA